jgi:hypothetical protein
MDYMDTMDKQQLERNSKEGFWILRQQTLRLPLNQTGTILSAFPLRSNILTLTLTLCICGANTR